MPYIQGVIHKKFLKRIEKSDVCEIVSVSVDEDNKNFISVDFHMDTNTEAIVELCHRHASELAELHKKWEE